MFILTDGKNYVMENPMKQGNYISTTSPIQAKEFTFKQARSLLQNKKSALSWIKLYHMVDQSTGRIENDFPKFSNEGVFCGDKDFEFDASIINLIKEETESIIGLATWDLNQLNTYISMLNQGLQYYDSAISDVKHAKLDKRPPAHIRTKIYSMENDLEEKRRDIKQARSYADTLVRAINERWTIEKIKIELTKSKFTTYKGRTKYYELAENILKNY